MLAARPQGEPTLDDFRLEAEVPEPGPGQMLLRTIYLSLDPYMRGRMNAGAVLRPPVEVGEVMEGGTVCEVVASQPRRITSRATSWSRRTGWQEYALSDGARRAQARPGARRPSPTRWACSGCRA